MVNNLDFLCHNCWCSVRVVDGLPRAGSHYNLETSRGPDKIGSRTRPAGRVLHMVGVKTYNRYYCLRLLTKELLQQYLETGVLIYKLSHQIFSFTITKCIHFLLFLSNVLDNLPFMLLLQLIVSLLLQLVLVMLLFLFIVFTLLK